MKKRQLAAGLSLCAAILAGSACADRIPWKLVTYPGSSMKVVTNDVWAAEAVEVDASKKTFALRGFYHGSGVLDLTKIKEDTGYSPVRMGMITWVDTSQLKAEKAIDRKAITEIILADEIETTTKQVYMNAENLGRIVCGANMREIGERAFAFGQDAQGKNTYKSVLSNVVLSASLETVGPEAFSGCTNLTRAAFPAGLQSVKDKAFFHCPIEGEAVLSIPSIGANAFCGNRFSSLTLAEGVTNVGERAFRSGSALEALAPFPSTLESIGSACFDTYDDLAAKSWPGPTGVVDFAACTKLRELPSNMFFANGRIAEVRLPPGVTSIGTEIFRNCGSLTNVVATPATGALYRFMQTADGHLGNQLLRAANKVVRFDVPWGGRTSFEASPIPFKTDAGDGESACALRAVYFFGKAPVPPGTACPQFMTGAGVSWKTYVYVSKKMDKEGWIAAVDHPDAKTNWFGWFIHGDSSKGTQRCPYAAWWKSPLDPVNGMVLILR